MDIDSKNTKNHQGQANLSSSSSSTDYQLIRNSSKVRTPNEYQRSKGLGAVTRLLANLCKETGSRKTQIEQKNDLSKEQNKYYRKNQVFEQSFEQNKTEMLKPLYEINTSKFNSILTDRHQRGYQFASQLKSIGLKAHKIISKCQFDSDRNNVDWRNNLSLEEKQIVMNFLKACGAPFQIKSSQSFSSKNLRTHSLRTDRKGSIPQLCSGFQDFMIEDICARLQPMLFQKGHILKHENEDLEYLHVICFGQVGVYQQLPKPLFYDLPNEQDEVERSKYINSNTFNTGVVICDPELNLNVLPFKDKAVVLSDDCYTLSISKEKYYETLTDEINLIWKRRRQLLKKNFVLFQNWDQEKLKRVASMFKERYLKKDEVLFHDGMRGNNCFYILVSGTIRLEKEVYIEKENFWPVTATGWESTAIRKKVLFKIREVSGVQILGEREFIKGDAYPVSALADSPGGAKVLIIQQRDYCKKKLMLMSTVMFPNEDEVKRSIEVLEQVQKIKKTKKIYPWVEGAIPKVKARLKKQIRLICEVENQKVSEVDRDGNLSEFQISPKSSHIHGGSFHVQRKEGSMNKAFGFDRGFTLTMDRTRPTDQTFAINSEFENFSPRKADQNEDNQSRNLSTSFYNQRRRVVNSFHSRQRSDIAHNQDIVIKEKDLEIETTQMTEIKAFNFGTVTQRSIANSILKSRQFIPGNNKSIQVKKRLLNKHQYIKAHQEKDLRRRKMIPDIISGLVGEAKNCNI
ncbi:UNKNOWN [Stylonychia lemnae]|uniref:Cyclic nucleotide-binding domain-containing protein n=1 Tax=Stylonychia lemnae TaxID=5949 RepID=A0A078A6P0_STYLE|nr:UNKNOWN [Stylonychia lemnae]|eukprot:CDW77864.1 UNKNOWN [Stylonychia lemnae]